MTGRPKHQIKEFEQFLRELEGEGWTVIKAKYFKLRCPCPGRHQKTMHLTPSNPSYLRELRKQMRRSTCWEEN